MQKMPRKIYDNREITIGSTTLTLKEWARRSRISFYTLKWRIDQGWPTERLFERREGFQEGMKVCSACGETKPSEGYYKRSRGGWYSECKACHKSRVISNTSAHK
jgi:hypothetical protein